MPIPGSERAFRHLFLSAALYNWLVAGIFGVWHQRLFVTLGIAPTPEPALYFHLFLAAVALFGYVYYCVSRDLTQTLLVKLGVLGKSAVFVVVAAYGIAGIASWHLIALAAVDLFYAALFVGFLRSSVTSLGGAEP